MYEINDILECIPYLDRNSWEQCRLNTYTTSMIDHKKVKMGDFISFPWEEKIENTKSKTQISDEEIKHLKELEKLWS